MKLNKWLKKKYLSAFSLIELSIVLLIIGVITGGIIAGQKTISLARLASARMLTNSSPVNTIEDLILWVEATSKDSFSASERIDNAPVSTWNDVNNQSTLEFDATQDVADDDQPTYGGDAINGLPALSFDGINDYFIIDSFLDPLTTDFTMFVVIKASPSAAQQLVLQQTDGSGFGRSMFNIVSGGDITSFVGGSATTGDAISSGIPQIHVLKVEDNGVNSTISISTNSGTIYSTTQTPESADGVFHIGVHKNLGSPLNGNIGELIVYDRALSTFEIDQIEEYLSKKWKIDIEAP